MCQIHWVLFWAILMFARYAFGYPPSLLWRPDQIERHKIGEKIRLSLKSSQPYLRIADVFKIVDSENIYYVPPKRNIAIGRGDGFRPG